MTHADNEPQEIRNMFDSVALSPGLHPHSLFEWGGVSQCAGFHKCSCCAAGTGSDHVKATELTTSGLEESCSHVMWAVVVFHSLLGAEAGGCFVPLQKFYFNDLSECSKTETSNGRRVARFMLWPSDVIMSYVMCRAEAWITVNYLMDAEFMQQLYNFKLSGQTSVTEMLLSGFKAAQSFQFQCTLWIQCHGRTMCNVERAAQSESLYTVGQQ